MRRPHHDSVCLAEVVWWVVRGCADCCFKRHFQLRPFGFNGGVCCMLDWTGLDAQESMPGGCWCCRRLWNRYAEEWSPSTEVRQSESDNWHTRLATPSIQHSR